METNDNPDAIKNVNISVLKGEIIGIVGQVGTGKTSLFSAIQGELRLSRKDRTKLETYIAKDGYQPLIFDYDQTQTQSDPRFDEEVPHVYIDGKIAYFSQQTHIFTRSARENILFGKEYIPEKYNQIVKMCCLEDDFKIMAQGDQTEIGGKGVTLSGGQKARVSLARAIYSDADIYLLDDPLSAVDAHVGKTIWSQAIMGYLRNRGATVLIASHQTQFFNDCDKVLQIVDGNIQNFDTV